MSDDMEAEISRLRQENEELKEEIKWVRHINDSMLEAMKLARELEQHRNKPPNNAHL